MFLNVVNAFTYRNCTGALTWPFICVINNCQCLWHTDKILFYPINLRLVIGVPYRVMSNSFIIVVHVPSD